MIEAPGDVERRVEDCIIKLRHGEIEGLLMEAVRAGIAPDRLMGAMLKGLGKLQEKYAERVIGTPELFVGAMIIERGIKALFESGGAEKPKPLGRVVLGTIGSPHEGGRHLVKIALEASGFEVHDIGGNRLPRDFIYWAKEVGADIVAVSCMVVYAIPLLRDLIEALKSEGIRAKTIVGGAVVDPALARDLGFDAYGRDMMEGASIAKALMRASGGERCNGP
jgi:methanogenic corrinoid protein MtbC1